LRACPRGSFASHTVDISDIPFSLRQETTPVPLSAPQSDVASDQPWTLTPKWNVPGSGEVDAALGKFRLDESGWLSGEPLVMVELKGAKVDLDRKMPRPSLIPHRQRR